MQLRDFIFIIVLGSGLLAIVHGCGGCALVPAPEGHAWYEEAAQ